MSKYIVIFSSLLLLLGCVKKADTPAAQVKDYKKIISIAPSITETLYFLGAGDKIIGVTNYCNYPLAAEKMTKIGTFLDLNLEKVMQLQPDLVVMIPSCVKAKENLTKLNIETFAVAQDRLPEVIASLRILGEKLGLKERGEFLADSLEKEINLAVQTVSKADSGKTVLVSTGREFGNGITSLYAGGRNTFFDDILTRIGLKNVLTTEMAYPQISLEAILKLNPDIIIDLVPELEEQKVAKEKILADWQQYPQLKAVQNKRVIVLGGRHISIPGPRLVRLIKEICAELVIK